MQQDQLVLLTIMFLALVAMVVVTLYRLLSVWRKGGKVEGGVDLAIRRRTTPRYNLRPGEAYLLPSTDRADPARLARAALASGDPVLFISRTYPGKAAERYRLGKARFIWLSRNEKKGGHNPTALGPLLDEIEEFLDGEDRGVVVVADLDGIAGENDHRRLLRFASGLREVAESEGGRVVAAGTLVKLSREQFGDITRELKPLGGDGGGT